jgi:membrane protease subunit (stomatin/prohibitin family)
MGVLDFITKQFIDVIQWTEPEDDILAFRFPMQDMEIQNGANLTVRESQLAALVHEGRMADVFPPGTHRLTTQNLPLLTNLMNWDKRFESPFKSDVYFFSTRSKVGQRWGTATPITIRDKEFGAVRLRAYGVYSYHISDPRRFHIKISGTRDIYRTGDLEDQLRNTIVGRMADTFAESGVPFLDMAANQVELAERVAEYLRPSLAEIGLTLDSLVVENLSLPATLEQVLDARVGISLTGDLGRYAQFQAASSLPVAAANEGGGAAGAGAGLGAGLLMAQQMMGALKPETAGAGADAKFCPECGHRVARSAKFCPECGHKQ